MGEELLKRETESLVYRASPGVVSGVCVHLSIGVDGELILGFLSLLSGQCCTLD